MRSRAILLLLLGLAWPAWAAKSLSIDQMEQFMVRLHGKPDGKVAAELDDIKLTQRVSRARLVHWEAEFPGARTHEELLKLADLSAFLDPPASDALADPRPDVKTQLHILSMAVQYLAKTMPRLPDFYAMRETTHFEGISAPGYLLGESTTTLNSTGESIRTVTYRDGREIPFENAVKRGKEPGLGLTTNGEFGPILLQVFRDALGNKIAFLRWEQGQSGAMAVFGYTVSENASHFEVDTTIGIQAKSVRPAYHGEIEIEPATGEILRLSEIAEMTSPQQMERAAIAVEFAPVTIGGRSYICPVRGVAFWSLPVRPGGEAMDKSLWPIQTFLNDVAFTHYHEFGSEARIVANPAESSGGNAAGSSGASAPDSSASAVKAVPSSAAPAASTGSPRTASEEAANPPSSVSSILNTEAPGAPAPNHAAGLSSEAPVAPASNTETPETKTAEVAAPSAPANTSSNPPVVAPSFEAQPKLEANIKVSSRLVVVDVVVRKGDHPVSGLQQNDFAVYEDGAPQTIRYFTPHFTDEQADVAGAAAAEPPALPPDTYTNLPVANVTDSVTVLLLDGLNTAPSDVQYVRREMISYLKNSPPDQRIAIFVLGQSLRMLQGFTTQTGQLMATLASANATAPASLLPPDEQRIDEAAELANMSAAGMDVANTRNWMAEAEASQTAMRADMTLEAMEQLSRYLGGVSGRKNLVWFSGSFPLQFFAVIQNPIGGVNISPTADFNERVKAAADELAAARIAIYPVDARGVLLQPMFAANQTTPATTTTRRDFTALPQALANGGPQGGTFGSDVQISPGQRAAGHASLDVLAEQTGGRAVYDSNGLQHAMADALSDGSNFYTLAYVSTNTNYNGAQRNIRVRLAHRKGELFYRHSYYADDKTQTENGAEQGSRGVFLHSMERGVPASSQIVFDVRAAAPNQKPPIGPVAGANSAMKNRTARYAIDYAANLATINLTENANGVRQGRVDALAIAYDRDGKLLNWLGNNVPIALDQAAWDQFSRSGLQIHQVLDLPAGDVYLRVGLYDPGSGRFGSMEIPLHVVAMR